jgi:Flp pilus assembly protein TadD
MRRLVVALAGMVRPFQAPSASAEEVRTLASLGYLSGAGASRPGVPLPDPKDHIATLRAFRELFERHAAGDYPGAIAAAREVLQASPSSFTAREMLSDSLVQTGRVAEGCDTLSAAVREAGPDVAREQLTQAYDNLAVLLGRLGRTAERDRVVAEASGRGLAGTAMKTDLARSRIAEGKPAEAVTILSGIANPDARALDALGIALAETGQAADAEQAFRRAIGSEPQNPEAAFNLGTLLLRTGRVAEAIDWLAKACAWSPGNASAWSTLGLARARAGDEAGAGEAWRRAVAADAREPDALFNLALWNARRGDRREAAALLERFLALPPPAGYASQAEQAKRMLSAAGGR